MDTCNSISLYKLNLSYEARIRIILWAMVLLLQNLKILQEQMADSFPATEPVVFYTPRS